MKKQIAILGSTGSIGTQALQVIEEQSDRYEVYAITANNRVELLIEQARKFQPEVVVIANEAKYEQLKDALSDLPIKVYTGAQQYNVPILPVDSEHSAIFQCLTGEIGNPIEKILLTASGGPFRKCSMEELAHVTKAQALKHPSWTMGAKITIDSATLMNKGFEVIEAKWLFGVKPEQIEVLVHPQSVIHSAVQFEDGSVKAQLGVPDMRLPIQYAFSYPDRLKASFDRLDLFKIGSLTFERPDTQRFRCLALAYEALHQGGNMACIVNAANEVVNKAFLEDRIAFLKMAEVIEKTMGKVGFIAKPTYEDYLATDAEARKVAAELF